MQTMVVAKCTVLGLIVVACSTSQPQPASPEPASQNAGSEAPPAPAESEPAHEPGPIGTKLMRDVSESKDKYEIGEGGGSGISKYKLTLNGAAVWPPTGEGCDQLVTCCTDLAILSEPLGLSCLLATGRDRDCRTAMATSTAIAREQSYPLPGSCVP